MLPTDLKCTFYGYDTEVEKAHLILFGVPYYEKTYGIKPLFPVTNFLRIISKQVEDNYIDGEGYYSRLQIADIGDLLSHKEEDIDIDIYTIIEYTMKRKKKFLMIGGSHMYTYYTVKHSKPTLLIILDAHLDLKEKLLGYNFNHATYLRRLCEEDLVDDIIIIGVRAFEEEEKNYAEKRNIRICRGDNGITEIKEILETHSKTYISIDLDHLDPSYMPHVTNPEPLGLTPSQTFKILSTLREQKLGFIGGDVVEYAPYSIDPYPGILASRIILELTRTLIT